jgi:hypothetical protein
MRYAKSHEFCKLDGDIATVCFNLQPRPQARKAHGAACRGGALVEDATQRGELVPGGPAACGVGRGGDLQA